MTAQPTHDSEQRDAAVAVFRQLEPLAPTKRAGALVIVARMLAVCDGATATPEMQEVEEAR